MAKLLPYVDVCIANEEDAKDVFGIEAENTDINSGKLDHAGYISVARQIAQRFGCRKVAITLRGSLSASDNDWAGMLYDAASDKAVFSPTYRIHIVDRVGGGDSFGGGLIYALMSGKDDQAAINFAVAASCLKHSIEHDFNQMSVAEVEAPRPEMRRAAYSADSLPPITMLLSDYRTAAFSIGAVRKKWDLSAPYGSVKRYDRSACKSRYFRRCEYTRSAVRPEQKRFLLQSWKLH